MGYYPIAIDITGRKCLVVGGGEVALRKVHSLLEAGARVTVIAPEVDPRLAAMEGVEVVAREYLQGDAADCALVFTATDDRSANALVADDANRAGALVNVVDDPDLCSFIAPAVVRRGDLLIAVTTSGRSPALSRRIRIEIEQRYGPEYGAFVDLLGGLRDAVKAAHESQEDRERVFNRLLDSGILDLLREGKVLEARQKALECIS
jgi:precorrin-2 dehydrogenase/sirohydrochlorin ferrochelatase